MVNCTVSHFRSKTDRQMRGVHFIENFKYSSDGTWHLQPGSHVAYTETELSARRIQYRVSLQKKDPSRCMLFCQLISLCHSLFNGSHHIESLFWEMVIVTYTGKIQLVRSGVTSMFHSKYNLSKGGHGPDG